VELSGEGFGVCMLTNGKTGGALFDDRCRWLFAEEAGIARRKDRRVDETISFDASRYVGRYEREEGSSSVDVDGGALVIRMDPTVLVKGIAPPVVARKLRPVAEHRFLFRNARTGDAARRLTRMEV
jgi:hypothetical protein